MSPYSLPALLAFAINASLVIIVLLDNLKSRTHRLFALLIICFALWNVADIIVINSATLEAASLGGAIVVAALLFASAYFLLLSFSFPVSINSRFDRLPIRPLFLILPLLFTMLSGLQVVQPLELHQFTGLNVYCYVVNEYAGVLNVAMFAIVFAYLAWGAGNLIRQMGLAQSRTVRLQVLHVLLGALGFGVLIVTLTVLHENQQLHFFASRGLFLLISFFFAYVVLGNRLLVLRRLGKQGLGYSLVTGLVFGFYLIVIKNIAQVLGKRFDVSSLFFETLLILALAVAFRPLVVRIQSLVENFFFQSMFVRRQKFIRFSRGAFHLTDLRDLARTVAAFLKEALSASHAELLVEGEHGEAFRSVLTPHRVLPLNGNFSQLLKKEQKAYEIAELLLSCSEEQREILKESHRGYIVPLLTDKGMVGVLLIGPTVSGRAYTMDEEEFLAVFANEVSAAIERNVLMEKMRAQDVRVAQMEKLAALGRLTAGIAHEFRNPLNIIATSAQTILRNPENGALHQETGKYILEETQRLNQTVDAFLQFAKPHTPVWQSASVAEVIDAAIAALQAKSVEKAIHIKADISHSIPEIITSPQHLERALMNLGLNAIDAMPHGGKLEYSAHRKRGGAVVISVNDNGPGIAPEHQAKIFDPFYTTKPTGTGLGLSIVYMMVQSIQGHIAFTSSNAGTTFTIDLPIKPNEP
jgi:signal transduction histidine kinase